MTSYTDRFGGSTIQPVDAQYLAVNLTASYVSQWPYLATDPTVVLAKVMNVIANQAGLGISLPDATLSGTGAQVIFYNNGSFPYTVYAHDGVTVVASIESGGRRLLVQADNSTTNGSWIVTLLGVGAGTLDIAGAAGLGLQANGTTLQVAFPVQQINANRTLGPGDRDQVFVWTGGAGTITLPLSTNAGMAAFNCEIRNQGTGTLTVVNTGGEFLDGAASNVFNVQESAWIHAGSGFWNTVGRGRNAQFNFTELQKTVTGGTASLTLTEASNVVQVYTGTLLSNQVVVLPSVVQVYYLSNQTSGAFSLTFKTSAPGGTTLPLPAGQNAVVFCDGTNVVNAATTTAGIGSITFASGTAASPSVQIGATNNGLFAPSSTSVGVANNGISTATFAAGVGLTVALPGNTAVNVSSTSGSATLVASSAAGTVRGLLVATTNLQRWNIVTDTAAESGSNAGSNLQIQAFNDAGTLLSTPIWINRATGTVSFSNGVSDISLIGEVKFMAGSGGSIPANFILAEGQLLSRTAYPLLWAYAQVQGVISDASWTAGNYTGFSSGDGSTTFRVPDLRGLFIRGLDLGRGIDAGRSWFAPQGSANATHTHGITDPTHTHIVQDPGHGHTVNDAGHVHTTTDPGHTHVYIQTALSGITAQPGLSGNLPSGQGGNSTSSSFTGITINGATSNVSVVPSLTGVFNSPAATGISVQAAGTNEARPINAAYPAYLRYQ